MDINEFYTKVAESLDLVVQDDYLMVPTGDDLKQLTVGGVPMVIPTRDSISSMLDKDAAGNIVTVKHLFNPLDETVVRGDSVTLTKLKTLVSVKLANKVAVMGSLLLTVGSNPEHQSKTGVLINKFLMRLGEAKNPGVKDAVDAKTIDAWNNLYSASFEPRMSALLKVYVKKGGKIGSAKYNRVTTIKSSIYEELCKLNKNEKLNGVRLRNKDITVFKILIEYLLEGITTNGTIMYGSNDPTAPGFVTIMSAYLTHANKIQMLVKGVKGVDPEWEDAASSALTITLNDLKDVSVFDAALSKIPRENDVARGKLAGDCGVATRPAMQELTDTSPAPVATAQPASGSATNNAIKKALYGGVPGINTASIRRVQPQQPMQQMQYPQQQQQYPQQQLMQPVQHMPAMGLQGQYPPQPQQRPTYPQPQQQQYPQQQGGFIQQQQPVNIGAGLEVGMNGTAMNTGYQQPLNNPWQR